MKSQRRSSNSTAGTFVVAWLRRMESHGLRSVYLRNYEQLPTNVGNDVDLLIQHGKTKRWVELARVIAPDFGWHFFRAVPFGCTSLFFFRQDSEEVLHVDLNERVEWHCISFADEETILSRRHWNGTVFIPEPNDELFLNIATRLIYQGKVREKHRKQWKQMRPDFTIKELADVFSSIGSSPLFRCFIEAADDGRWTVVESLKMRMRINLLRHAIFRRPFRLLVSTCHYVNRITLRLLFPPGLKFSFLLDPRASNLGLSALSLAAPRLARWGNLSECRITLPGKSHTGIAQWIFRARNGIIAQISRTMGSTARRIPRTTVMVRIPVSDGTETPEMIADQMVRRAMDCIADRKEGAGR